MMLITMHVGEALHFWALSFTTAYTVLAFFGYLGMVYATPTVDRTIRASAPAVDEDAQRKRAALVPFIPAARRYWYKIKVSAGQPDESSDLTGLSLAPA